MEPQTDAETQKLNDELLQPDVPRPQSPKRNSKDHVINKILKICEEQNLVLTESNSKLRRMTKAQLNALLAEKIEQCMKNTMAEQVGVAPGSSSSVIGLGALRMVHNIAAGSAEKLANIFLLPRGYEIRGFQQSLKEPQVQETIDQVLVEISEESDVLQYFESPYTRLALCWGSALLTSVRQRPVPNNIETSYKNIYAPHLESPAATVQAPVQPCPDWSTQNGEKRGHGGPPQNNVKSI